MAMIDIKQKYTTKVFTYKKTSIGFQKDVHMQFSNRKKNHITPHVVRLVFPANQLRMKKIWKHTCVMLGAKTMAMLRAFILLTCSCWTTSVIRLMAQSKSEASV